MLSTEACLAVRQSIMTNIICEITCQAVGAQMAIDPHSRDLLMTKVEPNLGTPEREPIHDIRALFSAYEADRFELHSRHLNNMMVRVLKTIGFDVRFVSGRGAHLVRRRRARAISTC